MGKKRTKPVVNLIPGYTAKQSQVIRGEIPAEDVNGHLAAVFLKRARELNDTPNIQLAEQLVAKTKEDRRQRNIERSCERSHKLNTGAGIEWKQPKSTEYTDHNKRVIRGEIPLEDVNTNELVSICKKAKAVGDLELAERIYDLILERRNAEAEKRHQRFKEFHLRREGLFIDNAYKDRFELTTWEKGVLSSEIDLDECSTEQLIHIVDICQATDDQHGVDIATLLLTIKLQPETVYVTQNHEQAINDIERMIGRPIRRPNTWFIETT